MIVRLTAPVFEGEANNLTDFIHAKLHPIRLISVITDAAGHVWGPTARRCDVLLPPAAPEASSDAQLLVEAAQRVNEKSYDLLVAIKLSLLHGSVTHRSWERCRQLAGRITSHYGVAVIIAQHLPALSVSKNPPPPHLHLIILPRRLEPIGFTGFSGVPAMAAHQAITAMWRGCRDAPSG